MVVKLLKPYTRVFYNALQVWTADNIRLKKNKLSAANFTWISPPIISSNESFVIISARFGLKCAFLRKPCSILRSAIHIFKRRWHDKGLKRVETYKEIDS